MGYFLQGQIELEILNLSKFAKELKGTMMAKKIKQMRDRSKKVNESKKKVMKMEKKKKKTKIKLNQETYERRRTRKPTEV